MNKKLKTGIVSAFDPPPPIRKAAFLKNFPYPKASRLDFFLSQVGYIRKRVWFCSILVFILSLAVLRYDAAALHVVWAVSSVLPFLALVTMSEITRSRFCGMTELEASCKYSLSQVVLVRLMVLGVMDALIFLVLLLSLSAKPDFDLFRLGIYLLMPFLLNSYTLLLITNRLKSRDALYAGAAITGLISLSNILLTTAYSELFTQPYTALWAAAVVVFLVATALEIRKLIKRTEELEWSLPLTA